MYDAGLTGRAEQTTSEDNKEIEANMALKDLAQRSGFTHAIDRVVLLQLELPASQPELRELFSCQLQIDDGPNEWRKPDASGLYKQLEANHGKERGVIGTIHIPNSAFREIFADSKVYRPLSLFGRETLLQRVNKTSQPNSRAIYGYSINARVRCNSLERLPVMPGDTDNPHGRIWLVRGEILSGGLIFSDPRVLSETDRNRLWPDGNLRGIFFTGSELQIEVGQKIEAVYDTFLPSQPNDIPLDKVKIRQSQENGAFLFHAHGQIPGAAWGDWKRIVSWDETTTTTTITLDPPYTNDTKPGFNWHYKVYRVEPIKRYRLTGSRKNIETGEFQRAVWEQIPATGTLSQLFVDSTHGTLFEPPGLPIQPPSEVAAKLLEEVQTLCPENSKVSIAAGVSVPQSASRPIVVVDNMDSASTRRELLRVDWKVTINLGAGPVDWYPRTLKVTSFASGAKQYELLDNDAVESELPGDSSDNAADAKVTFSWTPSGSLTPTIPDTRLIGTALDADRRPTQETRETSRELWFQALCAPSTAYAGTPLAWANISAQQPPAVPAGDGAKATRLSGPIVYKTADNWSLQAVPADPELRRATTAPGVRLTLKQDGTEKSAKLELFAADVTLDSPPFRIYDKPINDPKSVPNERQPQDGTPQSSLRFIHRPEWERVSPGDEQAAVICKHLHELGADKFVASRAPQAVRIYLPAERALIDPVSVTRGNLIGRQIVAFPLQKIPVSNDKYLKVVSAQPSTNPQGEPIVTLALEIADEEFPDDDTDTDTDTDMFKGFFAQLKAPPPNRLNEQEVPLIVARISKLERNGTDKKKATLVIISGRIISTGEYRLTVGPTRLALPRDVNHGLIPIGVSEFQINVPATGFASLRFTADKIRGEEGQSVLALHPWSEWGPRPEALTDPKRPWLTTGRVRLHHRNLIQEHAEFESSFEDRFPPEGPAKNPDGSIPAPLLPLADFIRAVRDRFTEATGNLVAPAAALPAKSVRNWLPNSKLHDYAGQALHPRVEIELIANDLTVLPEAKVRTELDIAEDPFSYKAKDGGIERDFYQSLKLRKATEPGADQHWLDASVRPEALAVGSPPTIRLTKTDPTDVTSRRAVDSSVPLLFSRHDLEALATIGLDDGRCIAIVGSPEQPAKSYLFTANGSISQAHAFPGDALVDVALLHHSGTIRGLAICKTSGGLELIRFTVNSGTGEVNNDASLQVIPTTAAGEPRSLACTPEESNATVFLLTAKPGVFTVHAETKTISEVKDGAEQAGAKATAIGVDRVGDVHYLAVGTSDGSVSVWYNPSRTWVKKSEGKQRDKESTILGKASQKVSEVAVEKDLAARSIRALCVLGDAPQPIVVAVDGTRFPCVWDIDIPFPTLPAKAEARVWLQTSEALSVAFGWVVDLEQRGTEGKLPFFVLGLRSGTVGVIAAIGRAEGLTEIRRFDTAETPITRLTLVGSDNTTKPAVCFAGTSAGGLLAWDVRRGVEWSEADRIMPKTYLDALGVVRAVPSAAATGDLTVDELSVGDVKYYSVTTRGLKLAVDNPIGIAAENLTDIRLWADSFKVEQVDGTVEPKQFPDGSFDPGHIAFFSKIVAKDELKLKSLATMNHVPRLNGIPFFVTGVKKLELQATASTWSIKSAVLEGVLINPDEVGAGQDPADAGTLPGIVVRALSRCKPIEVTLTSGSWTVTGDNRIDWTFAVNRQVQTDNSKDFPGAVARIEGSVSKNADGRLSIAVEPAESRALVFGRLWPFSESVTIQSHASFERSSANDRCWLQTQFSFKSDGGGEPSLNILSDTDTDTDNFSPKASLSVNFGSVQVGGGSLSARLKPTRRVNFMLGTAQAHAQFEQGGYHCLILDPPTSIKKANIAADPPTRGKTALLLWTAGDLAGVGFDPAVWPLKLCAACVKMTVEADAKAQTDWTLTAGTTPNQVTGKCSAKVHRSLLAVDVNDNGSSEPLASLGTVLIEATLHGQKLWLLLEGNVQSGSTEMTGQLVLEVETSKKEMKSVLQAIVRVTIDLDKKTIVLLDDVFWARFITPKSAFPEPEIRMPRVTGNESTAFSVNGYDLNPVPPRGFVRIGVKKVGDGIEMGIRDVDPSRIPLLPELEPSLMQAPDRIGNNEVRLSHRSRAGLAVRPNAPRDPFQLVINETTGGEPNLPHLPEGKALLLDTVVSTTGPVIRLRPEGWTVPANSEDTYRTDGLFVLNVDFRRADVSAVSAVEARTRKVGTSEPTTNERKRYRELLRAAGVQGVAITYRLTDGQKADLGFVDSPFYDHAGEVDSALTLSAPEISSGFALMAPLAAVTEVQPSWVYGFDPRFRLPSTLNHQSLPAPMTSRYVVNDLPTDPYADVCCLAHRQYRLERRRSTEAVAIAAAVALAPESPLAAAAILATTGETFSDQETPILHCAEVPAFRQPAQLSSPLSGRWLRSNTVGQPFASRVFFPPRVDWEFAADKPGAMFQSAVQARITKKVGGTRREPLIDFALREPQFIQLADCVTAEVFWQKKETKISPPDDGYANVNLVWTEVIGSVQVDNATTGTWLKPTTSGIAFKRTPLQLVIDFNSEVFVVNQADAAVPAYRVESQPENAAPSVIVRPAATYLVANPDVTTVLKPQTVAEQQERSCTITNDGGVWKATFTDNLPLPPSGTTFALTQVAHRFVQPHKKVHFELMQDTATEDGILTAFPITIGTENKTVEVLCRRPLCVEIDVADPNPLNGATITTTESVLRVRDGEPVTQLRLAQVAPGEKKYLIVTPSITAEGSACRVVITQADGYLEAAIRMPAKIAANTAKAWTSALTLTAPALKDLKLVGEHKLIRLESKTPAANGVFGAFGTFGTDKLLARPVTGNGGTATDEGSATDFLEASPTTYHLAEVDGNTPILIRLKDQNGDGAIADPGFAEGKAIAVRGVTTVPQANGTWVVKKLADYRYALYEPTVAETGSEISAVASAVVPLREAFPQPQADPGPRLRRLDLEPNWKPTDRPLLQVHWAGASQCRNDDGKGIAYRLGGVMVGLYEQIKQVKFIANSQLSPKLAFVMTAPAGTSWQRTILFGDASPPFHAQSEIVDVLLGGSKVPHFRLFVPDNRESLSVAVPASGTYVLDVIKSLPSGVVVYDRVYLNTGD